MKKYYIENVLLSEIVAIAKSHKIEKLLLFGSRARGDNNEHSDIDLAVAGGDVLGFGTSQGNYALRAENPCRHGHRPLSRTL